jgi:transcriptional regulator with XRE-family HTH domain
VAKMLGLSESMIYQVKAGKKQMSEKAVYKLDQAEQAVRLREALSLTETTPARLSEKLGTDAATVERWLKGGEIPNALYREIAHALRVNPEWLREGNGEPLDYNRPTAEDRPRIQEQALYGMSQTQSMGISAVAVRRWIKALRGLADDMEAELKT